MKSVFRFLAVGGVASLWFCAVAASAASKTPTLSFDVAVSATQSGSKSAARTMNAHVYLRGERVRVESKLGAQKLVVLWMRPYVYRLLPSSKSGVRYKASTPLPEIGVLATNWPELLNHPQKIRAVLKKNGARKIGNATLGGTGAEVYSADKWDGRARKVKLWLRRSDSLPLRLETSASGMKIAVSWKNYRRGQVLSPSLFAVPKDYRIREGQPPSQTPL